MMTSANLNTFGENLLRDGGQTRGNLHLLTALDNLRHTEQELERLGQQVEATVAWVRRAVAEGLNLNSLGELQRTADDFDRAVVLRQERVNSVLALADALSLRDEVRALLGA